MRAVYLTVLTLFLATTLVLFGQEELIIIDNSAVYINRQRPPVRFPHGGHFAAVPECTVCHHLYRKGKNVLKLEDLAMGKGKIKCAACHGGENKGDELMKAYHSLCVRCHKGLFLKKKKTGPVMCGRCHRKK